MDCKEQILTLGGAPYLLTMPPTFIIRTLIWLGDLTEIKEPYFTCEYDKDDGLLTVCQVTHNSTGTQPVKEGSPEYEKILNQERKSRFYFALLPLDEKGNFDPSLHQNYGYGEEVELGVFATEHSPLAAPIHRALSGDALARLVPTDWDPEKYTICDPENTQIKENPELINWIHYNGILISRWPYFQGSLKDCMKWNYLPKKDELYLTQ